MKGLGIIPKAFSGRKKLEVATNTTGGEDAGFGENRRADFHV